MEKIDYSFLFVDLRTKMALMASLNKSKSAESFSNSLSGRNSDILQASIVIDTTSGQFSMKSPLCNI